MILKKLSFLFSFMVLINQSITINVSTDGRCGEEFGVCREGYCCSKYGWCGNSDSHCKLESGCQSDYGICENQSDTTDNDSSAEDSNVSDLELAEECLERFTNIDRDEIAEIAETLNVSTCEAVDVYEYAYTSFKMYSEAFENLLQVELDEESNGGVIKTFFSYISQGFDYFKKAVGINVEENIDYNEEKCMATCAKTDKKIKSMFKMYNETLIDNYMNKLIPTGNNLLSICETKCQLIPLYLERMENKEEENIEEYEDIESDDEEEEEVSELVRHVKRATKYCGTKKNAKITVTNKSYKYGIKQYRDAGTAKTALKEVNGCGPKQKKFGIDSNTLKGCDFEPACNSHDICYACHTSSRKTCDDLFMLNMEQICSKMYPHDIIKKGKCNVKVTVFYLAVRAGGGDAYDKTSLNFKDSTCAACGVSIIKTTLSKYSFYLKK